MLVSSLLALSPKLLLLHLPKLLLLLLPHLPLHQPLPLQQKWKPRKTNRRKMSPAKRYRCRFPRSNGFVSFASFRSDPMIRTDGKYKLMGPPRGDR